MKKRKLTCRELSEIGGGYSYAMRTKLNGIVSGTLYHMCKKLTHEEEFKILSYGNTKLSWGSHRYAPEQTFDVVFIADKCF